MNTTTQDIDKLLSEKKYDEVRNLIFGLSAVKMTSEEKGAVLTGLARAYMDITNRVNAHYRDVLKQAMEGMRKINAFETKTNEKIKLGEVRGRLNV